MQSMPIGPFLNVNFFVQMGPGKDAWSFSLVSTADA